MSIKLQFDICSCVRALLSFKNFEFLLIQETVNALLSFSLHTNSFIHLFVNVVTKLRRNEEMLQKLILSTTPSHCMLMANNVQWFSQSDYSICINIVLKFWLNVIEFRARLVP